MIFDIVSAWPLFLLASPDFWQYSGVTRALSYTILSPVKEGEMVLAEGEVSIERQNGWTRPPYADKGHTDRARWKEIGVVEGHIEARKRWCSRIYLRARAIQYCPTTAEVVDEG